LDWCIYYGDGSEYTSDSGSPYDAPALDIQAIIIRDDNPANSRGRGLVARFDYYWWVPAKGEWFGGDLFGLFDYLTYEAGPKRVLFGRTMATKEHNEIVQRAVDDDRVKP
jgi:hypothetical protein